MRILSYCSLEFSEITAGVVLATLVVFVFFMVASSITLVCRPSYPTPALAWLRSVGPPILVQVCQQSPSSAGLSAVSVQCRSVSSLCPMQLKHQEV